MSEGRPKLRVGVVGVGHLGQHHARVLASTPGVDLVGVADARPEQARAVAERHATRAFHDYRDLLDAVDAVSVAVPTVLHREVASEALSRGLATLVEKPLAATLEDAEAIVGLAREKGALLQVGHIERFNPALRSLDGMSLRPKYVSAERLSTYTFRSADVGVVLDLMIHDIDLLLSMVEAPVRSVQAVGVSVFGGHEDVANARVEFEDGCVANLSASRASYQAARKFRIYGPEGYASLDFATRQATLIRPSDGLRRGEIDLGGLDLTKPAEVKERIFGTVLRVDKVDAGADEPLALELKNFAEAARGLSRPKVTGDDALRAVRLADAVLRSLHAHSWEGRRESPLDPPTPRGQDAPHALRGPILWRANAPKTPAGDASAP